MLVWPSGAFSYGRVIKLPFLSELITVLWLHFLGAFAKWRNAIISFVMSVCPSVFLSARINVFASTGRIFTKYCI
jgi:hypothetical protein